MTDISIPDDDGFGKEVNIGDIDDMFIRVRNFLTVARIERSQLYGAIIKLLLDSGVSISDPIVIGNVNDLNYFGKLYHVDFTVNEDKELMVSLMKNDNGA